MTSADKHYILPSDESEKERLNTQHQLLKQLFGPKLILPDITLIAGDKILDNGAGTGIWLLDLVKSGTLPAEAIAYGVDQNPTLFSKNPPDNIKFLTHNVTSLPEEWSDTFLLVNQRLLMAALRKEEWVSAINEMYRVLAPGGWVQLCEVNWWKAGPAVERELSVFKALYDSKGLLFEACREIPRMLHFAGFIDIHTVERHTTLAGEEGAQHRLNSIRVCRAIKPQIMSQGGLGVVQSDNDFESLVAAADGEMENNPDSDKHYSMFYAQKPYV